jgi:hypothetical protein
MIPRPDSFLSACLTGKPSGSPEGGMENGQQLEAGRMWLISAWAGSDARRGQFILREGSALLSEKQGVAGLVFVQALAHCSG